MFEERWKRVTSGGGSPADMVFVGYCLLYGENVSKDVDAGIYWLTQAASLNDGEAQLRLADAYESGEFVRKDCEAAVYWYQRAAVSSGFYGPYGVGLAYYVGSDCVPRDEKLALKYFDLAASRGHLVSKVAAARLLRSGRFGFWRALKGYIKILAIALEGMYLVTMGDPQNRFWDAPRWLPKSRIVNRMRIGTRFE